MGSVKSRSVVLYTLLRLAFFLVPLGVMMLFPAFWGMWWLAVLFAALIGLSACRSSSCRSRGARRRRGHLQQPEAPHEEVTEREIDEDIEDQANQAAQDD